MSKHHPTPNDQRSVVKNPTSPQYQADRANRIALGHPNAPPPPSAEPQPATPAQPVPQKQGKG